MPPPGFEPGLIGLQPIAFPRLLERRGECEGESHSLTTDYHRLPAGVNSVVLVVRDLKAVTGANHITVVTKMVFDDGLKVLTGLLERT